MCANQNQINYNIKYDSTYIRYTCVLRIWFGWYLHVVIQCHIIIYFCQLRLIFWRMTTNLVHEIHTASWKRRFQFVSNWNTTNNYKKIIIYTLYTYIAYKWQRQVRKTCVNIHLRWNHPVGSNRSKKFHFQNFEWYIWVLQFLFLSRLGRSSGSCFQFWCQ